MTAYTPLPVPPTVLAELREADDETGPVFIHADPCEGPAGEGRGYPFARPGALRTLRRYDATGYIIGGRLVEIPEDAEAGFDRVLGEAFARPGGGAGARTGGGVRLLPVRGAAPAGGVAWVPRPPDEGRRGRGRGGFMATRDQAARDAVTVEIGYALLTGVFLAGVAGLLLASPILFLDLHGAARGAVSGTAWVGAAAVLGWRLVDVLWRYRGGNRT